jgi:hypothetical protein
MLRTVLTIGAASAALTACTDEPTSAPIVPRMAGVNADVLPACNFNALRDAVRAYADVKGNDVIFDYIRDMSTNAYAQGMNGLARLAEIRGVGPKKAGATAAQGAAAVTAFLACMPVGAVQTNFATNIVSAMGAGGLFEVPTTASTNAVFSRGEPAGATYWAAKPAGGASWGSLAGGARYVVFGYKISNGFDYNVVPMLGNAPMPAAFAGDLIIGACGSFGSAVRVLHVADVLFDQSMAFCQPSSPPLAVLSSGIGGNLASLVRRGMSVFAPQAVYAFGGGVGGAVSELSPSNLLTVTPTISYTPQPGNNRTVGQALGIKVTVSSGGNPLNNAVVTLTVTGNSGRDALFIDPQTGKSCFQVVRTTQPPSGIADFSDIAVAKAGGYTLTAAASWDNLTASSVVSNLINVKNKKITLPPAC